MTSSKTPLVGLSVLALVLASSGAAFAQASPSPDATSTGDAPASDLSLRGHLGGFGDQDDEGGGVIGATALFRTGPVAVGALMEGGGALFGYSYGGVAALGGIGFRPANRFRLELLGSVGAHRYSGVGRGFMSDDPGASGSSAYVGARAEGSYLFGSKQTHLELGLYGSIDEDLSREVVRYRYSESSWLGGERYSVDAEHTIGTRRTSVVLALGMTRDFL